jgi:hypothetical protein
MTGQPYLESIAYVDKHPQVSWNIHPSFYIIFLTLIFFLAAI